MKRVLIAVCLLTAFVAYAGDVLFSVTTPYKTTLLGSDGGSEQCTALGTDAGVNLQNAIGYNLVASARRADGGTQSLHAAGSLHCCAYLPVSTGGNGVPKTSRWVDCPSALDFSVSSKCNNNRQDCTSGDYEPLAGIGRVAYVPNGMVVDGGTTDGGPPTDAGGPALDVDVTINVRRKP